MTVSIGPLLVSVVVLTALTQTVPFLVVRYFRARYPERFARQLSRRHLWWIFPLLLSEVVFALVVTPTLILPLTWGASLPALTLVALGIVGALLVLALVGAWWYLDSEYDDEPYDPTTGSGLA